jgi:hypothetical protein
MAINNPKLTISIIVSFDINNYRFFFDSDVMRYIPKIRRDKNIYALMGSIYIYMIKVTIQNK